MEFMNSTFYVLRGGGTGRMLGSRIVPLSLQKKCRSRVSGDLSNQPLWSWRRPSSVKYLIIVAVLRGPYVWNNSVTSCHLTAEALPLNIRLLLPQYQNLFFALILAGVCILPYTCLNKAQNIMKVTIRCKTLHMVQSWLTSGFFSAPYLQTLHAFHVIKSFAFSTKCKRNTATNTLTKEDNCKLIFFLCKETQV